MSKLGKESGRRLRQVPADDHCSNDWFPACAQQDVTGWVFGGDHHPQRDQAQNQQIHQVQHAGLQLCPEKESLFRLSFSH